MAMPYNNLNQYKQILEMKVSETDYNLKQAEKAYKQAQAENEAALREQTAFENGIEVMMQAAAAGENKGGMNE